MADIKNTYGTGLVEHWSLEETSGNRTGSFASNVLTDVNTVGYAAGKIGTNGADFEQSNSEYLTISSDFGIAPTGNFSFSFWVKFESTSTPQNFVFFNNDDGSADTQFYIDLNQGGSKVIRLVDTRENVAQYTWSSIATGTWYHMVATFKYNTASTGQNLYINGSLVASSSTGTTNSGISTNALILGAAQGPARYVDGVIDEFTVWSRALTSDDVTGIYNSGNGIPYEAAASGPASLKTRDTIAKASVKTIDGIAIASCKSINTIT